VINLKTADAIDVEKICIFVANNQAERDGTNS